MPETPTAVLFGLGLIGGSLGLALRKAGWHIYGVDQDPKVLPRAVELGAVDGEAPEGTLDVDVAVVAVPPFAVEAVVAEVAHRLGPRTVLTDVASAKRFVLDAFSNLEIRSRCVGGHPMAGLESTGIESARGDLFQGAKWIVTPGDFSDAEAVARVEDLARAAGAIPIRMDAETHDREVATLSHLPHAIAAALMHLSRNLLHVEAEGGSWRDCTRVGGVDPDLWTQIFLSNREEAAKALSAFDHKLTELRRALVAGDEPAVRNFLKVAREAKEATRA
jgi:prephenate dehydrogenase